MAFGFLARVMRGNHQLHAWSDRNSSVTPLSSSKCPLGSAVRTGPGIGHQIRSRVI
jgi:hypothetical protein